MLKVQILFSTSYRCLHFPVDGFFSSTIATTAGDISFSNEMYNAAPVLLSLEKLHGASSLSAGHSFDVPLYIHVQDEATATHFKGLLTYCQVYIVLSVLIILIPFVE